MTFVGLAYATADAYAMQIYCDFSGYSDMAIGLACMLNVRFPVNFAGLQGDQHQQVLALQRSLSQFSRP